MKCFIPICLLFLSLSCPASDISKALLARVVPTQTNYTICAVVWAQDTNGIFSDPTNACLSTNGNTRSAWWGPSTTSSVTNYTFTWSFSQITNQVPDTNIVSTNLGLATNYTFQVFASVPVYNLFFLQSSSNLAGWTDLSNTPYLRVTNGTTPGTAFYRTRILTTTNWQ